MKDMQREILKQVASGSISAEEGAARLEALESQAVAETATAVAPSPTSSPSAIRQIRVISRFASTDIVADPTVSGAVADGPHKARQEGDTLIIEQSPINEDTSFEFSRPHARVVVNGFDFGRRLTIRMNRSLPLWATVQAANLRIQGIDAPIVAEVQAGNCRVDDFRAPVKLSVAAGNIEATGRLESGSSAIKCEMGQVKVGLARGSSLRITARSTMGKVAIEGDGIRKDASQVTVGGGAGTLDLDCTMGNIKVTVG